MRARAERRRERAARNRRSLKQETLACLGGAVAGQYVDAAATLAKARRHPGACCLCWV